MGMTMMTMRHHGSDAVAELSAKSLVIMRMAMTAAYSPSAYQS